MRKLISWLLPVLVLASFAHSAQNEPKKPDEVLKATLARLTSIIEPAANAAPRTLTTQIKVTRSEGLPNQVKDATIDLAFAAPDHVLVTAKADNETDQVARDGQQLWIYTPGKHFGVIGSPDVPRFAADPNSVDRTPLKPFSMRSARNSVGAIAARLCGGSAPLRIAWRKASCSATYPSPCSGSARVVIE